MFCKRDINVHLFESLIYELKAFWKRKYMKQIRINPCAYPFASWVILYDNYTYEYENLNAESQTMLNM